MLRKFPPQTGFAKPNQHMNPNMQMMPQMMQGYPNQFMQGGQVPMFPQPQLVDVSKMDPAVKREYIGEILFGKITTNPNFASISE